MCAICGCGNSTIEGDAAHGDIQIGRRCHDGGVVAAQFQDGAGEAGGEARRHRTPHGG